MLTALCAERPGRFVAKLGDFDAALPVGSKVVRVRGTESIHPPEYLVVLSSPSTPNRLREEKHGLKDHEHTIAPSADVWAVGMLAHTLLFGKSAWKSAAPGRDEQYDAYLLTNEVLPSTSPKPLKQFFSDMLAVDRLARPTVEQIHDFLETRWGPCCSALRGRADDPTAKAVAEATAAAVTEPASETRLDVPNALDDTAASSSAAVAPSFGAAPTATNAPNRRKVVRNPRKDGLATLFTHPELRKRQLVMMFGWFTCSMLFYGISIAGSGVGDNPYVGFTWQAVAEVPGIVLAIFLLDWEATGRRGSVVLVMLESFASMLLLMLVVDHSSTSVQTFLAFAGKLGISAAFAIMYLLPVELIPTGLRVGSMGLSSMCSRFGGMLAPFIVSGFGAHSSSLPFLVFAVTAGLCAALTTLLPETRAKPLPQTTADVKTTPLACCAPADA